MSAGSGFRRPPFLSSGVSHAPAIQRRLSRCPVIADAQDRLAGDSVVPCDGGHRVGTVAQRRHNSVELVAIIGWFAAPERLAIGGLGMCNARRLRDFRRPGQGRPCPPPCPALERRQQHAGADDRQNAQSDPIEHPGRDEPGQISTYRHPEP